MPEQSSAINYHEREYNPGGGGMQLPMGWSPTQGRLKLKNFFVPGGLTYHTIIVKYNTNVSAGAGNWVTGVEHYYNKISDTDELIGSYTITTNDIIEPEDIPLAYIDIVTASAENNESWPSSGWSSKTINDYQYTPNGSGWEESTTDILTASGGVYANNISLGTFGVKSAKSVDIVPV